MRIGGLSRWLYSPFLVQLVVIRRCNLACGYCNEFDDHSPPVPFDELCKRIDKIYELGAWSIESTGRAARAPAARRPRRLREAQGLSPDLISNGYLWNEAMVHALNEAGLDRLQIAWTA